MTDNAAVLAMSLVSGTALAALAESYLINGQVLAAAGSKISGIAYDLTPLYPYITGNNFTVPGTLTPCLNNADWYGTRATGGTFTNNGSPPAGGPAEPGFSLSLTPSGSSMFPKLYFSSGDPCYPGVSYQVQAFGYPVSAAEYLIAGIDFFNYAGGYIATVQAGEIPAANAWNELQVSLMSPASAYSCQAWVGLSNPSANVPAGHTLQVSGCYQFTSYP